MAGFDEKLLFRPWSEIQKVQNAKLHHFVNHTLYPYCKYYRDLFDEHKIKPSSIRTVEDLRRIPFTSKKSMLPKEGENATEKNMSFLIKPDPETIKKYLPLSSKLKLLAKKTLLGEERFLEKMDEEFYPIFLTATTGTTNQPISFLYTPYDLNNLKRSGYRLMKTFGYERGDKVLNIFPYAPHLAFWQVFYGGVATNNFVMSTGGGKTMGTEGNIKAVTKIKPGYIMGVPSYLYHLLKTAADRGEDFSSVNSIVLGAGRVPLGLKEKISTLLESMGAKDVRIFGTYGFTESRCAWGECPTPITASSGYHTFPDMEVFEIIDPETGEVKGEGEDGEIVYSKIDGRGTCVFRYRTGDLVRGGITYQTCPHCGRTSPRISNDIYRASNMKDLQLSKIKGTLVDLNNLELILDDNREIFEWQIEIGKKNDDAYDSDILRLNVCLMDDSKRQSFQKNLHSEVLAKAEISFNEINYVTKDEIQDMIGIESNVKATKIVDKRPEL